MKPAVLAVGAATVREHVLGYENRAPNEKELEQYKKDGLARIDEDLNRIVLEAARDVLGRSISLSEHEELVRSALEKAKKKRFFS